jgi:hypothetical protein
MVFYYMGRSSKKKKRASVETGTSEVNPESSRKLHGSVSSHLSSRRIRDIKYYCLAGIASLITFAVYLSSLRNDFVVWDDDHYIFENLHIRSFDLNFFRWAFLDFHEGNWHPLTWVSHALDYAVWGLNPLGHHLSNNVLHAINTFVVVVLITRLMETWRERVPKNEKSAFLDERSTIITAGVSGLLFGLHPLHVESVAWVSERKDLLCALFFLLSILTYTKSAIAQTAQGDAVLRSFNRRYFLSLGFFALALLSKPMAVSLPAVLLILDWFPFGRIKSRATFLLAFVEKLPFFALSLASSILAVLAQKSQGAIVSIHAVPLSTRLMVAAKSLGAYLSKMLFPLDLIPFYPYPGNASFLSPEFFLPVAVVIGITAACLLIVKRQRFWLSAWLYYAVTLIPVLGIVQIGSQSMADRYTYLPSIGPFLALGVLMAWISIKSAGRGVIVRLLPAVAAVFAFVAISYLTVEQIGIWRNTFNLWTYVIKKEPTFPVAYENRAKYFRLTGQYDKAIADLDMVLSLDPSDYNAYIWRKITVVGYVYRGNHYLAQGKRDLAIADFQKACDFGNQDGCNSLKTLAAEKD